MKNMNEWVMINDRDDDNKMNITMTTMNRMIMMRYTFRAGMLFFVTLTWALMWVTGDTCLSRHVSTCKQIWRFLSILVELSIFASYSFIVERATQSEFIAMLLALYGPATKAFEQIKKPIFSGLIARSRKRSLASAEARPQNQAARGCSLCLNSPVDAFLLG